MQNYLLGWCHWHEIHITDERHAAGRSNACQGAITSLAPFISLTLSFRVLGGRSHSCQTERAVKH